MESMESMDSDSIGTEAECMDFVIDIQLALEPAQWPECCIYRIPKRLRKVNEEAYIPKLVSIGPFHHRREELRDMEMKKLRYLRDFFYRTGKSKEDLLKIIEDNEVKIRHSYSETFEHSSKEFVNMILLDAIFIIELFLRYYEKENDYILSQIWLEVAIHYDLVLLENQLPFFILAKLYVFAVNEESKQTEEHKKDLKKHLTFVDLSRKYFEHYDKQPESIIVEEVKHFTDLIRYLFCPVPRLKMERAKIRDNLYSATKLDDAGLKFKAVEKIPLLDIKFSRNKCLRHFPCFNLSWLLAYLGCLKCLPWLERMQSILKIPPIEIDDNTEALFRNLIALEQCCYRSQSYICNYALLLDYLIDTEKDVDLLVHEKVIVNNIGSNEEVAKLINKLGIEVVQDASTYCYTNLVKEINEYSESWLNRTMAIMKREFFRDFWRGSATIVGLIFLFSQLWGLIQPLHEKKNK